MTNKELFNLLTKEQQMDIVQTLAAFNKVHVEYYNGKYHITTSYCLMSNYPKDFKILNEFTSKEFYPNGIDYSGRWYRFWNEKERNGEENETYMINGDIHGKWQDEFEDMLEPEYQQARNYFLREVR